MAQASVRSMSRDSASPPPLMSPASPSSASSSSVSLDSPPRGPQVPIVRVKTLPNGSTSSLLWGDDDDETLIGLHKARPRPPPPKRRGTVATAGDMSRSTSMILPPSTQQLQKSSPAKMPKSSSFYARRASTSLLPEQRPRPASGNHFNTIPIAASQSSSSSRSAADTETLNAKMCVIGDAGVGKTSCAWLTLSHASVLQTSRTVINRYINGSFSGIQPSTIGASLLVKKMVLPEGKISFQLWDTAGQERFRSLAPMYYRDCEAAAIVFDLTNRASFLAVKQWLIQIRKHAQNRDNLVLHFVGAKLDLAPEVQEEDKGSASAEDPSATQRQVTSTEARELIHQWLCEPERSELSTPPPTSPTLGVTFTPPPRRNTGGSRSSGEAERPPLAQRTTSFFDFLPGRRIEAEPVPPPQPWAVWDYSEVSAKTNKGVEEIFLVTSRRLLVRRNTIKARQELRHKNSIYLNEAATKKATSTTTGYACC